MSLAIFQHTVYSSANRLTDIKNKLVVTSGEGEGSGKDRGRGLKQTTMYKINKLQGCIV